MGYAEEFPKLSNEIFHTNTVDSVIEELPKDLFWEIRKTPESINDIHSAS